MMDRHFRVLAAALLLTAGATACSSGGSSSTEVADSAGPGVYGVTAKASDLCDLLDYKPLAALVGTPTPSTVLNDNSSRTDVSRTTDCYQNLAHQSDPGAPQGSVDTGLTYWKDVDTAKRQLSLGRSTTGKSAKEGAATDISGVGTDAYRYTLLQSTDRVATLFVVARSSNLVITTRLTASTVTPFTDQQLGQLFDRMGDFVKAAFPAARHAAPAPTPTR